MSGGAPDDRPSRGEGSTTGVGGTPVAVDLSSDRAARVLFAVFLAGPVIWFAHFMLVYVVVEAGCTGSGPGLAVFQPPVATVVTLAATAVAAVACLWCARWAYRRWRGQSQEPDAEATSDAAGHLDDDKGRALAFIGYLLSLLSFISVLFVGLPALFLSAC